MINLNKMRIIFIRVLKYMNNKQSANIHAFTKKFECVKMYIICKDILKVKRSL